MFTNMQKKEKSIVKEEEELTKADFASGDHARENISCQVIS
jgi:hypothetical protein